MIQIKTSWLIAMFMSLSLGTHAQEYAHQADIPMVSSQEYYGIILTPELLARVKLDLSDLRLYDSDGNEQPYLIRKEKELSSQSLFKEYQIVDKAYKQDAISHLIFSNPEKNAIDNVSILVKNTDVKKRARLSGSDDQKNWYVIKNNYLLHSMKSEEETTELKILNFPLSDYAFFKLEIDDNWRLPINILKVGYYDTQKVKGRTTRFDCSIVDQKDSLKNSYVRLALSGPKYIEKLKFKVSGADFYSRSTKVMVKRKGVNRKKKTVEYMAFVGSLDLNSNSTNEVDIQGVVADTLYIEIENRDNPPLRVEEVQASFLNQYLIAELKPGMNYSLQFGNEDLVAPQYDIVDFADQIPQDVVKLKHEQVIDLISEELEPKAKGFFDDPYMLWLVIGGVGLVLAVVSVRMIKDMGKN